MPELPPENIDQIAQFSKNPQFPNPINTPIVEALKALPMKGRILCIVDPNTVPITRPTGAVVLFNSNSIPKRLAAWPDLRVQARSNPNYVHDGMIKEGFDPAKPISSMTIMVTEDTPEQDPVLVRTVILESPEYLAQEKYIVREERNGRTIYVVKNAIDALGLTPNTYAIIPGWSYIQPGKRAGEEGAEGITNIKDLAAISRTIVRTLNAELKTQGIDAIIISQQDGKILDEEFTDDAVFPNLNDLDFGTEIDPEETDENGKKKWYVNVKIGDEVQSISIFKDFALGGRDSAATASFARRSHLVQSETAAHIVENGLGPVFTGDAAGYGVEFNRK